MGNAFPSRQLREPLPLPAGKFPRSAPRCHSSPSSLDLRSSSPSQISCLSWSCFPSPAPPALPTQAPMPAATPPSSRLASDSFLILNVRPASSRQPCDASRLNNLPRFLPAFPRGSSLLILPPRWKLTRKRKLRSPEVPRGLSTGRCDTLGHLHGMMKACKKSCAHQRG